MNISTMHSEPTARVMRITPEQAAQVLAENNTKNRKLKNQTVTGLMRAMRDNPNGFNGSSIVFGPDGVLLDGQHRLEAIRRSGQPCTYVVVWGVESKEMATIDTGVVRSFQDYLEINNDQYHISDTKRASSTTTLCWNFARFEDPGDVSLGRLNTGGIGSAREIGYDKLAEFYLDNRTMVDKCGLLSNRLGAKFGAGPRGGFCAAAWYIMQVEPEEGELFLEGLLGQGEAADNDAVLALSTTLLKQKNKVMSSGVKSIPPGWTLGVIIKGWNHYVNGSVPARAIQFIVGGAKPNRVPKPQPVLR